MPDEQHTPAQLNRPATASFHTSDPFPMLRTAEFDAITTAEELQLAAQTVGQAAAQAYLFAVALRIRSVLPTAHQLVVDTAAWLDQRGENRPDITEVFDREGNELFNSVLETSDVADEVLEACTLLDHGLRYADPWIIKSRWEGVESTYGPSYRVTLPELTPDLQAALRAAGRRPEPSGPVTTHRTLTLPIDE
jgi:hypothetical protein